MRRARTRIAEEAVRRTGDLDLGGLDLTQLPPELFELRHLRRLNLGTDIGPEREKEAFWQVGGVIGRTNKIDNGQLGAIGLLSNLEALAVGGSQLGKLESLVDLKHLSWLDCSHTPVSDLRPLSGLTTLQFLNCSHTPVSDLGPLSGLTALQMLDCSYTRVTELGPLSGLAALQQLNCRRTQVSNLRPLSGLTALQQLDCRNTWVTELGPLSGLTALQMLDCSYTRVTELGPLSGLAALQQLYCRGTQVSDLGPLSGLIALRILNCSRTQVTELGPLSGLIALQMLDCSGCWLTSMPEQVLQKPFLRELVLFDCRISGVPAEVLSQEPYDDCLASLRAHFDDLAAGMTSLLDVKLLVLGNGGAGKTQLCRRLQGEPFDRDWNSTHGVQVTSIPLCAADGGEAARLHIWDFGGQDIYHGTHALFVRTLAVFLLVWAKDTENADEYEHGGICFRNHPLQYWMEYVQHQADADSPVLIVQTKCDKPGDGIPRSPVAAECLEAFRYRPQELRYSAATDRGRAALDEALRDAVAWLREPGRLGLPEIGAGRMRVQRRLEAMRDADAALPSGQRRHRTLGQDEFRLLCEQEGGISSPEHLLNYLNNAGVVFYRRGLFDGRIVLDQTWALDAIYAVFQREKCYRPLQRWHGRFTRPDLELLVWQDYGIEEQKLFLSMMRSCGICFVHRQHGGRGGDETEYVAPDLLPKRQAVQAELDEKWPADQPPKTVTFEYPLLHPGLMREVIARIGGEAGVNALYWRGGVCVYEATTRSRALIEQEMSGTWQGRIHLRTQGGQAEVLLQRLVERIEEAQTRIGLRPTDVKHSSARHRMEDVGPVPGGKVTGMAEANLDFRQPPVAESEWLVSYAWGDATPEGRAREAVVDELCAEAERRGIRIQRDRTTLGLGERISKFMRRIGQGNRVFVVLSDKYLKSPYCMFELHELWRTSKGEAEAFLQRTRIYCLPDVQFSKMVDRLHYAEFWEREHGRLEACIKTKFHLMGPRDFDECLLVRKFYQEVSEILGELADIVRPRTLEELKSYGFDDAPSEMPPVTS